MVKGKFNCIVDAAHGSSAKGAASARLAELHGIPNVSTNNYPNAGHTVVGYGHKFVSKVLPSPAAQNIWGGLRPTLWVGPGSAFFMDQLNKELKETHYDLWPKKVRIHERAVVMDQRHLDMEAPGGLQSTEYISSTMSGSGAAYAEKAMRRPDVQLAREFLELNPLRPLDFAAQMRNEMSNLRSFLHEVSQGFALSVNHGSHYPFCTFRDCTPQQAYADMLITKEFIGDVYLNVRSFPIRVGSNYRDGLQVGYSGDFLDDQEETTWEKVAADAEFPPDEAAALAERERTTVTKKIRRVATQSWRGLAEAAIATGATHLILNFPQYIHWSAYKVRGGPEVLPDLHPKVRAFMDQMQEVTNLPLIMVGTSAEHDDFIWLG